MDKSKNNSSHDGRRPLKVRASTKLQAFAQWLSKQNVHPNTISLFSIVFATCAAISLLASASSDAVVRVILIILSAVFIQCRLLCNLFDGLVAVEGGKGTPSGELFNDFPDRIADAIILIAVGYAIPHCNYAIELAWFAAILAIMTAYTRTLASSLGSPVNFQGPMAKQHRMAVMTLACLVSTIETLFITAGSTFFFALMIVIIGSIFTIYRRLRAAYQYLEQR